MHTGCGSAVRVETCFWILVAIRRSRPRVSLLSGRRTVQLSARPGACISTSRSVGNPGLAAQLAQCANRHRRHRRSHAAGLGYNHRSHRERDTAASARRFSSQCCRRSARARPGVEQQRRFAEQSTRRRRDGRALTQASAPRPSANAALGVRHAKRQSSIAAPDC